MLTRLKHSLRLQVAATIAAHTNSISVGMCQGYSAVLIPQLEAANYAHITHDDASWIGKSNKHHHVAIPPPPLPSLYDICLQ